MLNDPGMVKGWQPFAGAKVLEIGANVGVYTKYCLDNGASVTAYEADPVTFRVLSAKNLPATIISKAIWTHTGTVPFRGFTREECGSHNGALGHINCPDNGLFRSAEIVSCIALDEAIGDAVWDCIKIDVEGAEFEMLLAASDEALSKTKFLYVEFHPWWVAEGLYERTIERLNRLFDITGLPDYAAATRKNG